MSELKQLLGSKDWNEHPLGPYEGWPVTLRTALGLMMESRFPKMIFWGEPMYCFYNDAFRPSLGSHGKHPSTFGMAYKDAYPEATKKMLPLMREVLHSGKATYFENQLVPIYRNGQLSEAFWTFTHYPIRSIEGNIEGIFLDCFEMGASYSSYESGEETEDFRSLADTISQPVFATSDIGSITYSNNKLLEYSGKTFEDLQKLGWSTIVHEEDLEDFMAGWQEAIKKTEEYITELRYLRHDGQPNWFLTHIIPVLNTGGNVDRWVGSATDIQDFKYQQKEKDIFIGMASHELKTPVTSIKGYVQMLQKMYAKSGDEFLTSSLRTLDRQIKSLTNLISDMLDLSKMQTGNLELNLENILVDELIKDVIAELSHVHQEHNFIYNNACNDYIHGDKDRISQVLINFLTNAIKYAPSSRDILITCESDEDHTRVSVTDKGVGLSPLEESKVFERFYRAQGLSQKTFPGLGIGLFIAEDIIRRHKGKIGVKSVENEGSTFYFSLPTINLLVHE